MGIESQVSEMKNKGKSIFQIAFALKISVEEVIRIIYEDKKLSKTTKYRNYAPVKLKCLCCGKEFISKNKKTNRICLKCKKEQEHGCLDQYFL